MPVSSRSPDDVSSSYGAAGSNSVEAQSLQVLMRGVLFKSSQNGQKWDERHCLLRSGVFAYFRTREKMNSFENCIVVLRTNAAHSNTPKRKIFKSALTRFPPRGFIKLLNRIGRPVSYILTNDKSLIFQITHISSQRSFFMKCGDYIEYSQWCQAFTAIGVPVTEEKKTAPMAPRTSRVDISAVEMASVASEFPDDAQSVITDHTNEDRPSQPTTTEPPQRTPKIAVESQSNQTFTASVVEPSSMKEVSGEEKNVEDKEKERQRKSEERAIDAKIETLQKTEEDLEQEAEALKQLLEREKQSTSSFFTSVLQ